MQGLELWGGPECTVNRIGDEYCDQFQASGHYDRLSDLDLFADLGISAIRYPLLWEHVAPDDPDRSDWTWVDERLTRLRQLNIRPIAGLVHHGSGPRYTNLLADTFAPGLARHAGQLAERHPWIEDWTPVNEPVTTARFSGLYGLWYPHHRDERSFWLALLNQIDAVRFSMREVRRINPAARLIQTDDLGRTYATAAVREQAAFDNVRRWMSWDLLCGRVVPGHQFWQRLCKHGFEARLRDIADNPCPPDIIGVNHYLTSDRFLDHRVQRYPARTRGGNGKQVYADTEAVRVLDPPPAGLGGVLREAWDRYRIPLAITEVHNGCTREEQLRWMAEAWTVAGNLKADGVDMRAVTSWSLLGSRGWDTLLTGGGAYEPGVYDVSSGTPEPTALVGLLKSLTGAADANPLARGTGWWRRPIRLEHRPVSRPAPMREHISVTSIHETDAPLFLLAGIDGERLDAIIDGCRTRGLTYAIVDRAEMERASPDVIGAILDRAGPWAVMVDGSHSMASACAARGIPVADICQHDRREPQLARHCRAMFDRLIDQASLPGQGALSHFRDRVAA